MWRALGPARAAPRHHRPLACGRRLGEPLSSTAFVSFNRWGASDADLQARASSRTGFTVPAAVVSTGGLTSWRRAEGRLEPNRTGGEEGSARRILILPPHGATSTSGWLG